MFNRSRTGALAVAWAMAVTLAVATPAGADAGPSPSVLMDKHGPAGVTSDKPDPALAQRAHRKAAQSRLPALSMKVTDPGAAAKVRRSRAEKQDSYYCTAIIEKDAGLGAPDQYLEETAYVDYYAELECNFYLDSIDALAGVIDRSEPYHGEVYDGVVLGTGSPWHSEYDYYAYSEGARDLYAKTYNGGREVEAAFELYLLAPPGFIWDSCNPIPGLRYLVCEGLGTEFLHVVLGTDRFSTGLTRACRNLFIVGDDEQARLEATGTSSIPASTEILNQQRFGTLKQQVLDFKSNMCLKNSGTEVDDLAAQQGQALWDEAVRIARNDPLNDDRGLYWARLSMTRALRQYIRFPLPVSTFETARRLDEASRGMNSHDFIAGIPKKAFVSGFDPFGLAGGGIYRGNPSAASVLKLDNTILPNGAEVEAVIFPVRYEDFNGGLIEEVFEPHLRSGGQQATIITTVSQGSSNNFELEFYNGRNRASFRPGPGSTDSPPLPDNRNLGPTVGIPNPNGTGSYQDPVTPPLDAGTEFTQTTLPLNRMVVGPTDVDRDCDQQPARNMSAPCPSTGPTAGQTAVQGSGGGYLSNEIAYRVTRLHDEVGSAVPSGHVHTPIVSPPTGPGSPGHGSIPAQYLAILNGGLS